MGIPLFSAPLVAKTVVVSTGSAIAVRPMIVPVRPVFVSPSFYARTGSINSVLFEDNISISIISGVLKVLPRVQDLKESLRLTESNLGVTLAKFIDQFQERHDFSPIDYPNIS